MVSVSYVLCAVYLQGFAAENLQAAVCTGYYSRKEAARSIPCRSKDFSVEHARLFPDWVEQSKAPPAADTHAHARISPRFNARSQ